MIEKHVILPCGVEEAFALFTRRIGEWWPPERRHTKDPASLIVLSADGPFFERASNGHEVPLGRVLEWDAPVRIVLDWYPGTDPEHPTRVEVRFSPEGAGTRVEVQHGPTAASADLFPLRAPRYDASWDLVLRALRAAADG